MRHTTKSIAAAVVCAAMVAASNTPSTATPTSAGPATTTTSFGDRGDRAIARIRADADSRVRIHRDGRGVVDFVAAANGKGIDNPDLRRGAGTLRAVRGHLSRYGPGLGLRPGVDRTRVSDVHPSLDGSVVRLQQDVNGVPVLGGEVVLSMDESGDLRSMHAETSTAQVPASGAQIGQRVARQTALNVTAKAHDTTPDGLGVGAGSRWFYDPALLDVQDPLGAREVWRFEVTNGFDVRELVLVDTETGRVALHFNQVSDVLRRAVCDNRNVRRSRDVPCRSAFARKEGGRRSAVSDVNRSYEHTKAAFDTYKRVAGIDLTSMIGRAGRDGVRRITSSVRWCFTRNIDPSCPMANAFWNGQQMYYGRGFANADDVVGHELTHGVIERTSNLLYLHQSGAINESLADVMGEIVDHRYNPARQANTAWLLGEDLPGRAVRNMRNPARSASPQPDRMTSRRYWADQSLRDNGGVHVNSGIGNKTAYLISQGGTFNGFSMRGLDARDPRLFKTAKLYVAVIRRLTSGSDYADLGRVLNATCAQFVASRTAGFTSRNCATVRKAVLATELDKQPVVAGARAPEASSLCPSGTRKQVLYSDGLESGAHTYRREALWFRAPNRFVPANATSGDRSLFGLNPDPSLGDPASSAVSMAARVQLPEGQRSFLHFKHWHLFEWVPGPARYFDGGFVGVRDAVTAGPWADTAGLPWVNGPVDRIRANSSARGFGGDSHGYVSSRVELTSFGGQSVQARWQVRGDANGAFFGWYIDDISMYTCAPR